MISGTITDLSGRTLSGQTPTAFWTALEQLARQRDESLAALMARVDAGRPASAPLASALRLAALKAAQKFDEG